MTISEMVIDLSGNNNDNDTINAEPMLDTLESYNNLYPIIEDLTVLPCPTVIVQAPGAPEPPTNCPSAPKYSGDAVTLKATPSNGIGPYIVTFKKNGANIVQSRLGGLSNPITSAPEDIQITRVYTLDDLDISSASTGTIDFSVLISDSCPTGAKTCESICTINIGCIAPVCNFTVT